MPSIKNNKDNNSGITKEQAEKLAKLSKKHGGFIKPKN